jgi:uncharacterized protein (TIGR03437 family)
MVPRAYITAVTNGAGWRDDLVQGVSPGGIAVILGGNFIDGADRIVNDSAVLPGLPVALAGAAEKTGDAFEQRAPSPAEPGPGGPLPLQTGDLSVQVNGVAAPIFSIAKFGKHGAITIQIPVETAVGRAGITVRKHARNVSFPVTVLPVTPGLLEIHRADASRESVILHADGSLVDLEHPARRGETLRCFATGLGPLRPPLRTNQPGPSEPSAVAHEMAVGIHNQGIPFLYARSAPGMVGVEEIGFQVPPDAPPGRAQNFAISVQIGGKMVFANSSWIPVK